MNITVYCGANSGNDKCYTEAAAALGKWMAEHGHRLVYGGGKAGMMGAISYAVLGNGGQVTGVIPSFMMEMDLGNPNVTEMIVVETMGDRKRTMIELGDAFIALPGGSGTLEEISEIVSRRQLGLMEDPCIFFSVNGYYRNMEMAYDNMLACGFLKPEHRKNIQFIESIDELERILE